MEHIRLSDTAHPLFEKAWDLYEQSFPLEERRPLLWQRHIMAHPSYHFEPITQADALIGILLWWGFEDIRFVEHFATVPTVRGRGYGRRILQTFSSRDTRPVLLEVEPPHTEYQRRRIRFYEQNGFALNHHAYQQPPYHPGQEPLTLLLMSYPAPISAKAVAHFIDTGHPLIYSLPA